PFVGRPQLALRQRQNGVRIGAAVVGDPNQCHGIRQDDQTRARDEGKRPRPTHQPAPPGDPLTIARNRLRTSRNRIAVSPRTKKKRYFGIASHHQSKNLVYRKITKKVTPVLTVSGQWLRTPAHAAAALPAKPSTW